MKSPTIEAGGATDQISEDEQAGPGQTREDPDLEARFQSRRHDHGRQRQLDF